jgi:hypothetical protein
MSLSREMTTLDRLLDPVTRCLTPEVARRVAELRADPELQDRMELLATRNTEGRLTAEETEEYETYVRASRIIAILQAKARALRTI